MNYYKTFRIIYICIFCIAGMSCKHEFSYVEFENYIKSENYKIKEIQNPTKSISVSINYIPSRLIAARESLNKDETLQEINIDKYKENLYFNIDISNNQQDLLALKGKNYQELVNNLCYNLDRFLFLRTDKNEEINLITFHTPRTYGLSNSTNILLVFNRPDLLNNKELILILDSEIKLFKRDLEFKFSVEEINKIEQKNIVL